MHKHATTSTRLQIALLALLLLALPAGARAGEFHVASCQADRLNFSTTAFADFATRGMRIRRACNPEGPGLRGLVTANSSGRGTVPRGAVALVATSAPTGTRFTTFRWAGSLRRRDCRSGLPLRAAALRGGTGNQADRAEERAR